MEKPRTLRTNSPLIAYAGTAQPASAETLCHPCPASVPQDGMSSRSSIGGQLLMECIAACTHIQPIADPVVDGLAWFADLHLPVQSVV